MILMITSKLISYLALITLIFSTCEFHQPAEAKSNGFTTDLIHRDSPHSPSYDPSLSSSQRIINALKRSFHRARRFKERRTTRSPQSDLIYSTGAYLMKFSIGTPPLPSIAIADTGSDIIWTQCQPCLQCINQSLPIFQPKNSSTYTNISCNTPHCNSLPETYCSSRRNCLYSEKYEDGSFTYGQMATDTFTLASNGRKTVSVPKITFGCGFKNGGIFSGIESGIVGLGRGEASLVRQLGRLGQGRFSYCLVSLSDHSNSSKLHFGANARVSGSKRVVSTPLVERDHDTFYYLTLEGISVGNQRLEFDKAWRDRVEGNIIIDSGTTFTLLPPGLYDRFEEAIKSYMKLEEIEDPEGELRLCYLWRNDDDVEIPEIRVELRGGDVKWKRENVFVRTSDASVCLAVQPSKDIAIYGNLAQVNFLVGYDLVKGTVSFKPTHCGTPSTL
ncbi:Eukaryotic aspartyl protease family protein [Perilla frutescens var. hirtella]|uniref:Eukaryotic aspartyl protease family protein n=1 Tax=Perilla frutescens var. hirtella TaxID=608512 RepID=A0AAD4J528_PERFH|nr:Eukaryotic aspartyl protease family protein [Perilla frutescens var. hirtella]